MPHHRQDGTQTVDEGCLVLEQSGGTEKVWALPDAGTGGWQLPRWQIAPTAAMRSTTTSAWDASNVIGDLQEFVQRDLGLQLPWMSWIADSKVAGALPHQERLCRVYGHLLDGRCGVEPASHLGSLMNQAGCFVDPTKLEAAEERGWVRQWVQQVDSSDRPVKRGIGVARETAFSYGHQGKAWGTYRVGAFTEDGLPAPNPLA